MSARVVAVIVNFRCAAETIACVASLDGQGLAGIVVVENGSGDDSAALLRAAPGGVGTLLELAGNGGFGAGCNRGIERALADHSDLTHVLLINPDAQAAPGLVDALAATAQRHPDAGIVGGRVLSRDGARVQFEAGRFRPWTLGPSHTAAPRGAREFETGFVTGALMLVAADLLRDGLRFDETYFLYVEDLDLCRQVCARGRTLWVTLDAEVRHVGGGSQTAEARGPLGLRPSELRYITRNKVYLARKWLPFVQRVVFYFVAWVLKPVAGIVRTGSVGFLGTYFGAVREGFALPLTSRAAMRAAARARTDT